ncbi:AH receptor-interacting protein [Toxorhynchites rutilus septentrionalis]|uniref:AH receptor-interacting protein n=1 Tax=Toxorhynchites rutilus septentrionalis TaxID=329112 RepID=UPI0024799C03|nr:AH receptor-interacting protein [Toxorhynchites rutilus septentrionalis]
MDPTMDEAKIVKETLHAGSKVVPFRDGAKISFHYQTRKLDGTVIDDSRKQKKPMELVLGKKFKFEVWEVCVQKMALHEVAKFRVDKSLVQQYPFVSKTIRDAQKPSDQRKHCCGMTIQNEGIGYKDLDELFNSPQDLEFVLEIVSIESPEEYEKESWQLNDEEKVEQIKKLREKGNDCYARKDFSGATEAYSFAAGLVEQLMLKEKPNDTEWLELAELKIPLLLNYSQCKLLDKDYYAVIQHCSEVLDKYDKDNVKALFRRAKAHIGAWNPDKAKEDFQRAAELDPALAPSVAKELKALQELIRIKDVEDKLKFQKMF